MSLWSRILGRLRATDTGAVGSELSELWDETAVRRHERVMIPADDIFHLRWLSSWNSLLGTSRIGLYREAIGLSIAQTSQAARLAGNGARPSGVFETTAKLSKDVIDRLKE